MITTDLPVKPYVGHFLKSRYGDPVNLSRENMIGKFFYLLISDDSIKNTKTESIYKDTIQIKITEDVFIRKGYMINHQGIIMFNNFVTAHIKERMFIYVDALLEANSSIKIKQALEQAMHKFMFNENVFPYETLKKSYDRYRLAEKKQIKYAESI